MEKLQIGRDFYATSIGRLRESLDTRKLLEKRVLELDRQLVEAQSEYVDLLEAQKILSTVSDDNTTKTLDFVCGLVNKVLMEIFPEEPYYIKMTPKLYAGSKPHIVTELYDCNNNVLDISIQSGDGIKQVICFMYVMCLIELRKGRRLLILDERLNGLHKSAKNCISSMIEIFTKGGFQFMFVEYSLNDIGKIYNVERIQNLETGGVESIVKAYNGKYYDEIIHVDDVDLSILSEEDEEA